MAFLCPPLWDLILNEGWEDKDVISLPVLAADIQRPNDRYRQPVGEHITV